MRQMPRNKVASTLHAYRDSSLVFYAHWEFVDPTTSAECRPDVGSGQPVAFGRVRRAAVGAAVDGGATWDGLRTHRPHQQLHQHRRLGGRRELPHRAEVGDVLTAT